MPNRYSEKIECWRSLSAAKETLDLSSIIVVGNLNTHLHSENIGESCVRDPMREKLEDLISNWDLQDIKPTKGKYTWSNKR